MKRIAGLLLVIAFVLALMSGCADSSTSTQDQNETTVTTSSGTQYTNVKDENDIVIAHIHANAGIQASAASERGIQQYLQDRGLNWQIDIYDAADDASNLVRAIEDSVAKGVDAIIFDYGDLRAASDALRQAREAGIPVITISAGSYFPNTLCDISFNNAENACKLSAYLVERVGTTGNVVLLDLDVSQGARQRSEAFRAYIRETPGYVIIEDYNVNATRVLQDVTDVTETFLQKYGIEGIDAFFCAWDEAAYAVSRVLTERGYTSDDCIVTGVDGHWDATLSYMQSDPKWPQQATIGTPFGGYGQIAVDLVYKICVQGRSWEDATNGKTNIYLKTPLITVDNVAGITPETNLAFVDDYYYGDYTRMSGYVFSYEE